MRDFCWRSRRPLPPAEWDLRRRGWALCGEGGGHGDMCEGLLLADGPGLTRAERGAIAADSATAARLLILGIERAEERVALLRLGCAEVLPAAITLEELDLRAARVAAASTMLPRRRQVGPVTLDLCHRDAAVAGRWVGLFPREFELFWRLTEQSGGRVTRAQLLKEVWRLNHDPETNRVEVHVSRLRAKLAFAGAGDMIGTDPAGGYFVRPSAIEPPAAAYEEILLGACTRTRA